ncbi:MAG TPA: hypothetical protein VG035_02290 [Actinomycetota bacterium]|nr:hypothetical protein [Actinomycetota bacterium]
MSHGVVIALELAGAVLILAGLTLAQLRLLDQHSLVYLVLNLVGSFVLAVIALADERWGFLLLEGVWAIVSAISLANVALGGGWGEDSPPNESGGAAGRTRPGVPRRRQMLNLMWSTSPSWTT